MLNENFRLAVGGSAGTVGVTWTAPSDDFVSFVFVNGRLEAEGFAPGMAERGIDIPFREGQLAVIEVHDFAPDEIPNEPPAPIAIAPTAYTRPVIRFSAVPGAARYRLYHRPEDGTEARIGDLTATQGDGDWLEMECPDELLGRSSAPDHHGRWHFFRVEAVSAYGQESQAVAWAWRALDVPPAPTIAVAAGDDPGTFTFTLTGA